MDEVYIKTVERMEHNITAVDHDGALASIAISLKRIADYLYTLVLIVCAVMIVNSAISFMVTINQFFPLRIK